MAGVEEWIIMAKTSPGSYALVWRGEVNKGNDNDSAFEAISQVPLAYRSLEMYAVKARDLHPFQLMPESDLPSSGTLVTMKSDGSLHRPGDDEPVPPPVEPEPAPADQPGDAVVPE